MSKPQPQLRFSETVTERFSNLHEHYAKPRSTSSQPVAWTVLFLLKHDLAVSRSIIIGPGSMLMTKFTSLSPPLQTFGSKPNNFNSTWRSLLVRTEALLGQSVSRSQTVVKNGSWSRSLAQVRPEPFSELWFTASFPAKCSPRSKYGQVDNMHGASCPGPGQDHKPPDERTLKLGKTLRALSPLLSTIFTTQLPNEILSPSISLHLFPSTHPHLPVVKSRVPCRAALWTAPVAWGSVPIVGNIKLEILSEKIVRTGFVTAPMPAEEGCDGLGEEKLVVRWKTEGKKNEDLESTTTSQSLSSSSSEINRGLSTLLGGSQPLFSEGPTDPFTGLFIFSFDKDGKIASLTIEHADESNGFDKTSKMVTLTDWLLGKARWGRVEGGLVPGLAYKEIWCRDHNNDRRPWQHRHRGEHR